MTLMCSVFLILVIFLHDRVFCVQPVVDGMDGINSTLKLEDIVKQNRQMWNNLQNERKEQDRANSKSVTTTGNPTVLDENYAKIETEDSLKKPQQLEGNILKVNEEKIITKNHSGIMTSQDFKKEKTDQKKENESHLTVGLFSRGKLKIPVAQSPNNNNWQETGGEQIKNPLESPTTTKVLLGNAESVKETDPKYSPTKENPVEEVKYKDTPNRLGEEADKGFLNDQINIDISNITPRSEKQVENETQANGNYKQSSVSVDSNSAQSVNNDCSETKCSTGTSQEQHCYGNYCTYVLLFASSLYWHHTLGKF